MGLSRPPALKAFTLADTHMEQSEFNFGPDKKPENKNEDQPALEGLGYDNLIDLYQQTVGKDPKGRSFNRGRLIEGINRGKDEELRVLAEEDMESDKDDLKNPYSGKK